MTIPVYFINGLLESGKTEFINYTIESYIVVFSFTILYAF
mgnify:CR=1 FL=1